MQAATHTTTPSVSRAFLRRRLGLFFFVFACLALAGCTAGRTDAPRRTEVEGGDLVILQSDGSPAFAGVTRALGKKVKGSVPVLSLTGHPATDAEMVQQLRRYHERIVVAVGLNAALVARKLSGTKVIFCQVFNYEDFDLLTPWMKGVSAIPPIKQQFQVWKKVDPSLKRVGVITGPRLSHLIEEARSAASANGIEIKHAQVGSDLETLYAFKQLNPKIQALWLLPDNRVLSRNTIRDILSYSRKQGKQVVVFSEQLLSLGGMMSFDSVYGDIADQVLARSKQALQANGSDIPGPPVLALTRLDIKINPLAVKQLGLKFPAELKASAYVP